MAIYYYLVNVTRKCINKKCIFEEAYFNIYWCSGFQRRSEEEQLEVFRRVIELNADWSADDTILACPDSDYYGIQYDDGVLSYVSYEETQMYREDF